MTNYIGAKVTKYDVAIMVEGKPESAQIVTCAVIEGYSTVDDIAKMIEFRHGAGWKILAVQQVAE